MNSARARAETPVKHNLAAQGQYLAHTSQHTI